MVVKSKIGRRRYIVFKIDSDSIIQKKDLIYSLKSMFRNSTTISTNNNDSELHVFNRKPWLISLNKNYGLIRCHHLDAPRTIQLLQTIETAGNLKLPIKITTLGTAGTIRSARKKYLDKYYLYP